MDPVIKSQLRQNVQRFFLEFLEKFQEPDGNGGYLPDYYYVDQARGMIAEKRHTLFVKMSHLKLLNREAVSFDPDDLRSVIELKFMMVRDALNAAVPQLLSKLEGKEVQEEVRRARENDELKFTAAFFDMDMFSGIRDLRTEKQGHLITICGTITRITDMKPELLTATYQCSQCQRLVTGIEQQFKRTMPTVCPSRTCGNKTNWHLRADLKTTRFGDWQRIRLQENENEIPAGSMPRSIDVVVRDEICERGKAGDKVLVTGSLIVVPDVPSMMSPSELKTQARRHINTRSDASYGDGVRGLKSLGQRDLTYRYCFFATSVDEHRSWNSRQGDQGEDIRSEAKMYLLPAEKERFNEIAEHTAAGGRRDGFDILARSVAPSVHGHLEVKKGILLMLVGGLQKKTGEGIRLRGDINVCVIGDPATSKSAMLKWTSQFLPRAVFTSGKTSTAAGLTAGVVKDADLDNEKMIEPGALMLADNGICCIDEFELMDEKDQVAIHEAMEQQTITLCKAGIKATLNARASILASVLPKNTYYQPTQPLYKNIQMTAPIMSRFDLMFVIQDVYNLSNDQLVAQHLVNLHLPKKQDDEASLTLKPLSQLELQKYIRVARTFRPKMTHEAREHLTKCYKKLREERHVRGGAGVTVRQLESLLRLSEAIARVYLCEKVLVEHVKEAYDLQQNSLKNVERENIDLNPDVPADLPEREEAPQEAAGEPGQAAVAKARQLRKVKISYNEYERLGQMLANYLEGQELLGKAVSEEDLLTWYLEQVEGDLQTDAQFLDEQHKANLVINRLIDKDRVIVEYQPSPDPVAHPEKRLLMKHPNYVIGQGNI